MKNQKGITLLSLIITIVTLCIAISILTVISDSFFKNTEYLKNDTKYLSQYNKFTAYFVEDVKHNKDIFRISSNEIIFEDGTKYNYETSEKSIYRNKVKICENIDYCKFTQNIDNKDKKIINVVMNIKDAPQLSNNYVLKYW